MLFSSISFIYYFLPLVFIVYFLAPKTYKNMVLLISSLLFYFFGEPIYTSILIFSTIVDFIHSLVIEKYRGQKQAKIALISSIVINVSILGFFKYYDFFIENINVLLQTDFELLGLSLPIGISFFTFQTMSYTIDVYRGEAKAQKSIFGLGTYIALFPQLIAGPIVRYKTIAEEINKREHSYDNFAYGISRFVIGLCKKVLIANALGELSVIAIGANNMSVLFYWIGAIAFSIQIYFDFSGYSDMAIGLGRIFGFHFLENFNYPYVSRSISEFWSRWHISLGSWFKDYVYIPLGGNRGSRLKWFRNIFIVWFLTGFWHGASWNFVIWGLYFGMILFFEKLYLKKILERLPSVFQHAYVLFIILISFVIFNNESLAEIALYLKGMFGLLNIPIVNQESLYYLKSYSTIIIISIIGATPFVNKCYSRLSNHNYIGKFINIAEPLGYIALILIITGYLVDASFNPFLYFRF